MEATTSPIGAARDAIDGAKDGPYDLRPRKGAVEKAAPGAGAEALSGAAGRAGVQAQKTFGAVDAKPAESAEEFSDAVEVGSENGSSDQDRYELRSEASVSNSLGAQPPQQVDDLASGRPREQAKKTPRLLPTPPPRASQAGGEAGRRGHRHAPPPVLEEMTWEELDAYRRVHREFQRRAMEERVGVSPRPDEPFNRRDLRSAGREARLDDGDRRGPRTSRVFGTNFTASSRRPGARPTTGELSDRNMKMSAAYIIKQRFINKITTEKIGRDIFQ